MSEQGFITGSVVATAEPAKLSAHATVAGSPEQWFEATGNLLWVWIQFAASRREGETPPIWVFDQLGVAAEKMVALTLGRDFRNGDAIEPTKALALVAEALGLAGGTPKNAFANLRMDWRAAHAADWWRSDERPEREGVSRIEEVSRKFLRCVCEERARHILAEGSKLLPRP